MKKSPGVKVVRLAKPTESDGRFGPGRSRRHRKDLANVIGTEIKKMSHIEHVAGEGYRLKKGKG